MTGIVEFVFSHGGLIVSLLAAALWIRFRPASRTARRSLLAIITAYTLASIYIIPYTLGRALVLGYKPLSAGDLPAGSTAIVVLSAGSGSVDDWDRHRFFYMASAAASRTWEARRVYLMLPDVVVIASESTGDEETNRDQFTPLIHDALVQLGIPSSRVVSVREPADTHDEAVRIAPLLKSLHVDHVVLVTSDFHMRRSLGAFRAQGVDAIPAIARDPSASNRWLRWLIPSSEGFELSAKIVHEILGLAWYAARGWLK
jgi:uncharacterized SAM-binding protein YcdF (DUF218 family)